MQQSATQPWARRPNEPTKWFERFSIYLRLGPERSLHSAYVTFRREHDEKTDGRVGVPKSWKRRFDGFEWQARAEAHDNYESEQATAEYERRRADILNSGFALQFERVHALKALAVLLKGEIEEPEKRWLPDVKQIGSGDTAERVDIVRFNAALIEQFRETLDDLAQEQGERVKGVKFDGTLKHVDVTSDEMAKARSAAAEWESKTFGDET